MIFIIKYCVAAKLEQKIIRSECKHLKSFNHYLLSQTKKKTPNKLKQTLCRLDADFPRR